MQVCETQRDPSGLLNGNICHVEGVNAVITATGALDREINSLCSRESLTTVPEFICEAAVQRRVICQ